MLANYCDVLLRRNQTRKYTEDEVREKLTNVVRSFLQYPFILFLTKIYKYKKKVTLLKYVQNKDVFMKYHKAHLTRRLILEISNDQEMEEQTVMMLKVILKTLKF